MNYKGKWVGIVGAKSLCTRNYLNAALENAAYKAKAVFSFFSKNAENLQISIQ